MDPIKKFPVEVAEMIFGHLSGSELKTCTLVATGWNELIGSSARTMRKLKLMTDRMEFTEDPKEFLGTTRNYRSIHISDCTEVIDYMSTQKRWSSVEIHNTVFDSTSDLFAFLEIIASTVEYLVMTSITIAAVHDKRKMNLQFKKLKSLKISYNDKRVGLELFDASPLLKSLTIIECNSEWSLDVVGFLKQHEMLKSLKLSPEWFNRIFNTKVVDFPFNLEEIVICNSRSATRKRSAEMNFASFLQMQAKSIKQLDFDGWFGFCFMTLPYRLTLKEIRLSQFPGCNLLALPKNESIESMDIAMIDGKDTTRIKILLAAVPNLKHIRMRQVDDEVAEFIAANMKHLLKINVVHRSESARKILPNVEWL